MHVKAAEQSEVKREEKVELTLRLSMVDKTHQKGRAVVLTSGELHLRAGHFAVSSMFFI
jgi:hypothetical protein